jgi:hypothetical protein
MFSLLLGILFFPVILPFLILRFVFKLLFALVMVPFVLLVVAGALFMAFAGVMLALLSPLLLPLAFVALLIWAVTRHSRAASALPG